MHNDVIFIACSYSITLSSDTEYNIIIIHFLLQYSRVYRFFIVYQVEHRHWHIPNVSIELLSSSFCDSNLWVLAVCCGKMQCKRISMYLFWMLLQSEPVDTFFFVFIVDVHSSLSSDVNSLLCNKYFIEELSKKCWNAIIYYVF